MAHYRILVVAILVTVVTSLPWHDGFAPGRPRSRSPNRSFPGAICDITQDGSRRTSPCFPDRLLTCETVQDLPVSAITAGITELSVCVPISCDDDGDRVCYNADRDSQCSESLQELDEDDLKDQVEQLCPNLRTGGRSADDDYDDDYNDDDDDDSDGDYDDDYNYDDDDYFDGDYGNGNDDDSTPTATPAPPRPATTQSRTTTTTTSPSTTESTRRPPTRLTRFTRVTQATTPTLPTFERLVLPQEGSRCTLSTEVKLAQKACRIESSNGVIQRDCPPGADGTIPECNTSPDCQVTINYQSVSLYMCPSTGTGRNPNGQLPPGRGGFLPPWSRGGANQDPEDDQGQGNRGQGQGQGNRGQGQGQGNRGQGQDQGNRGQGQGQGNRGQGQGQGQGQGNRGQGQGQGQDQGQGQGQGNPQPPTRGQGRGNGKQKKPRRG